MSTLEGSRRWRRNRMILGVLAAALVGVGVAAWLTTPAAPPPPMNLVAPLATDIVDPGSGVAGRAPSADPAEPTTSSPAPSRTSAKPTTSTPAPSPTTSSSPKPTSRPKPTSASPTSTSNQPSGDAFEQAVRDLVDQERKKAGCGSLRWDDRLATAARKHSTDMAERNYFAHNSQDGRTPSDRVRAEGYPGGAGENIAAGQNSPEAVMTAWMNSSGHRANILNCSYQALGVGLHRGGSYRFYWTQNFGLS